MKSIIISFVLLCVISVVFVVPTEAIIRRNNIEAIGGENRVVIVKAEGNLRWINMTNLSQVYWRELALVDESGIVIAILIGGKAEILLSKIGEKIKIKGILKPHMTVRGVRINVIEVREWE